MYLGRDLDVERELIFPCKPGALALINAKSQDPNSLSSPKVRNARVRNVKRPKSNSAVWPARWCTRVSYQFFEELEWAECIMQGCVISKR